MEGELGVSCDSHLTYLMCLARCFGLLVSPGKDVKGTEMNLLDNMVS